MDEDVKKYNEELLKKIKEELEKLEIELKDKSIDRKRIKKKMLLTLRLIAPYIITATAIIGIFDVFGAGIPFIDGKTKKILLKEIETDTLGNTKIYETYDDSDDSIDITFTYADKFKINDDGTYSRNITVYDAEKIDRDVLLDVINNKKYDIEGLFKKVVAQKVETRTSVTREELKEEFYMSYSYYDKDKNEYIYENYSLGSNIFYLFTELVLITIMNLVIYNIRYGNFNYKFELEEIDDKYRSKREYIKKLIRVKKENYDLLAGNNNE